MARNYPRFLFSNPINTKTTGPFIVHTLFPRGIFRINYLPEEKNKFAFSVAELDWFDECSDTKKKI